MRLIALLVLSLVPLTSWGADVPARVGRLAFAEGAVALYQDPEAGWEKAYVNSPITSENSLWTDPGSRAELRVSGIAVRLDESTQFDIAQLDDDDFRTFVARGTVAVRVRHFYAGNRIAFATPQARFRVFGTGRFRIDVDPEQEETLLTVFAGTVSMRSASGDMMVEAGRAIRIYGGADPAFVRERAQTTGFDRWTLARDERWIERNSTRYVSTYMTGYEDLDAYGTWIQEPTYGALWVPTRVERDWVPYRYGRWTHVRPWGWTWVDDQPWGYAPFHYGRWVYVRERWAWYPGPRTERPMWAPALVAWVGGSNWNVSVRTGDRPVVGWYPLAPTERYQPSFQASPTYVSQVNHVVVNNVTINNYGARQQEFNRAQAITAVQRDQMIERRQVQQAMVPVGAEMARSAPVAPPQSMLPTPGEVQRMRQVRAQSAPPSVASVQMPPGSPSASAPQQAPGQPPANPLRRDRGDIPLAPVAKPTFALPAAAPAPAPATPAQIQQQAARPAQPAAAPGAPMSRGDDPRMRERAARDAQEAQDRAAREAQRPAPPPHAGPPITPPGRAVGNPFVREDPRTQERAAREAQQQQQQQQQAQERAAREAAQAQERAARDQQQQAQDRARAQERAAQEQAQRQQQQQAQERAAREAQRGQPAAQPPPPGREAAPAQPAAPPAAQPTAQPRGEPARGEQARGRDKDKDKDKDKDDEDKPGKGRGR